MSRARRREATDDAPLIDEVDDTIVAKTKKKSRPRRKAADLAARAVLLGLLGRMHDGAVIIEDSGRRHLCGHPTAGEIVPEIEVLQSESWRAIATEGSSGLGRTYFEGGWKTRDLDELTLFLRVVIRNLDAINRAGAIHSRIWDPLRRAKTPQDQRPGSAKVDRQNIHAHYDLGNEVFELFLDKTMTYSCAIFDSPDVSLHDAQIEKLDRICRKLGLTAADDVLEIGTGWGSFAIHAAGTYGCRVTTTTISDRQFELATQRVKEAGLSDLVTVLNQDYRTVTGTYDKLVSIEMIEALDWHQYDTFFDKCSQLLRPDGLMGIQAIVMSDRHYDRAKHTEDFIKRYIFPGSCLPSIGAILASTKKSSDLQMIALDDIGHHYAETLRRWRVAFAEHESELAAMNYGTEFQRLFEFYLCYCEAAFAERRTGDVQCFFAKPGWRDAGLHALPR